MFDSPEDAHQKHKDAASDCAKYLQGVEKVFNSYADTKGIDFKMDTSRAIEVLKEYQKHPDEISTEQKEALHPFVWKISRMGSCMRLRFVLLLTHFMRCTKATTRSMLPFSASCSLAKRQRCWRWLLLSQSVCRTCNGQESREHDLCSEFQSHSQQSQSRGVRRFTPSISSSIFRMAKSG